MSIIVSTKHPQKPYTPIILLLKEELIKSLRIENAQIKEYLKDGMPHYLIGQEYRFIEKEVLEWLKTYKPSQERLEREFRDKKGRSIEAYVDQDIIRSILRVSKDSLKKLCKSGLPFVIVGEKCFFHIEDILDYYRKGDPLAPSSKKGNMAKKNTLIEKAPGKKGNSKVVQPIKISKETTRKLKNKEMILIHLGSDFEKNTPLFIVDGSYNLENNNVGTGLVMIENREIATGYSYVKKINTTKTNICEYIAILDALRIIKRKKIQKAIVVTDQEHFAKGININLKKTVYEPAIKPYMKEINQLMLELEGKVIIEYVGNLKEGNKNLLYKKAHLLSRKYKKGVIQHLEIAS